MTWGYREHRPSPALASLVACTWESLPAESHDQTIVPDGCVDLIWLSEQRLVVAGADTGPRTVTLPPGRRTSGIRLLPGAAGAVLGLPASELRDQQVDLEEIWGTHGSGVRDAKGSQLWAITDPPLPAVDGTPLREALAAARPHHRLVLLEAAVAARHARPDPLVVAASRLLSRPRARVAEVADQLGVSSRSLHRRTLVAVGYGPKTLARVARLRQLVAADDPSLAGRAFAAGYANQAHMNDEVRRLTGSTPVRFLEDALPVTA